LEGRPWYLPKGHEEVRPMSDREMHRAMMEIHRIFKKKTEIREACLKQLKISIKTSLNTLNPKFIKNYLDKGSKVCVIILFCGHSDKDILKKLNIYDYTMLNILCYDKNNNQSFYLQLENLKNKKMICEFDLGKIDKQGRLLNLVETHKLICNKKHKVTYAHDPCTDVRFTKCIFDYIIRRYRYENLIKHCY
jgi:hypothetical protein